MPLSARDLAKLAMATHKRVYFDSITFDHSIVFFSNLVFAQVSSSQEVVVLVNKGRSALGLRPLKTFRINY